MPSRFLSLIFLFNFIIPSYFEKLHCDTTELKSIDLKDLLWTAKLLVGWESNFSIRPPRVFKILSTTFQWTQAIERDLVERSTYAMILGNNTKFLVSCLYVAGSNLGQ